MNREEFSSFVGNTIEDAIPLAEVQCGRSLARKVTLQWLGLSEPPVTAQIVERIVEWSPDEPFGYAVPVV